MHRRAALTRAPPPQLLRRIDALVETLESTGEDTPHDASEDLEKLRTVRQVSAHTRRRHAARDGSPRTHLHSTRQVLRAHPFSGINRKVQLKPVAWETRVGEDGSKKEVPVEALFILKWGGELTHLGEAQSAMLGARFRNTLYPGELSGVLRLHSTYRHRELEGACRLRLPPAPAPAAWELLLPPAPAACLGAAALSLSDLRVVWCAGTGTTLRSTRATRAAYR